MHKKIYHIISFHYKRLRNNVINYPFFFKMKLKYLLPLGFYDTKFLKVALDEGWKNRIQDVVDCSDNKLIKRHPKAGEIKNGKQLMHNGIAVTLGGYYGAAIAQMLSLNKGVHEPQEEYAFQEVLKNIKEGATMVEYGSYWSFYSIWFQKKIKNAHTFLVEPDIFNMQYGINNFKINNVKGNFYNAFIGKISGVENGTPIICTDNYVATNKIEFIDILHSDIQGFEYDMLLGSAQTIKQNKIGYIFISTHGNDVHCKCLQFLEQHNFKILCSADEFETYSLDGLIVARAAHYQGLDTIEISLKRKEKPHA